MLIAAGVILVRMGLCLSNRSAARIEKEGEKMAAEKAKASRKSAVEEFREHLFAQDPGVIIKHFPFGGNYGVDNQINFLEVRDWIVHNLSRLPDVLENVKSDTNANSNANHSEDFDRTLEVLNIPTDNSNAPRLTETKAGVTIAQDKPTMRKVNYGANIFESDDGKDKRKPVNEHVEVPGGVRTTLSCQQMISQMSDNTVPESDVSPGEDEGTPSTGCCDWLDRQKTGQ
ncbi:hypothetical protein AAMO2058_001491000 [Amorphochlora amoebiformis]